MFTFIFVGASPYALLFRPYRATLDYIAPFLRPFGSFVPAVESGKAERQAAKPSGGHNHDWDLGVHNPEGVFDCHDEAFITLKGLNNLA